MIEISANRLTGNLRAVQALVGPAVEVLGVIKADAYGHGASLCARVLAGAGLRWLGVGDVEEGRRVREVLRAASPHFDEVQLVVMCGFAPEEAREIAAARLTPVIWTAEQLQALQRAATRLGPVVQGGLRFHLEIDTGMARQGVAPGPALEAVLRELRRSPGLVCEGVFSHLHSSEVAGSPATRMQQVRFGAALEQVVAAGVKPALVHLGNSSAVEEGSTLDWLRGLAAGMGARPMVRPGLALYGYTLPMVGVGGHPDWKRQLRPVARWTAQVIGLRHVEAGDTVGYGATWVAREPASLALLPVGYADGLRREASSGVGSGWVMIGGRPAPVVGRVSMNLTVVDITAHAASGVPVAVGTEAVLLGEGVCADEHARWAKTISYEILCGMRGHRRLVGHTPGTLE